MASKKRKSSSSSSSKDEKRARLTFWEAAEEAGHDTSSWHQCSVILSAECIDVQLNQTVYKNEIFPVRAVRVEALYCKWLTELCIRNTSVTFLPPDIGVCASLVSIDIRNTAITLLPAELAKCDALEELYCMGSDLTEVPPELARCKSLRWVDLSFTKVTTVPGEWGDSKSLDKINLYGCPLTSLPVRLGKCETLQCIVLTHSMVRETPQFFKYSGFPNILNIPAVMRTIISDEDRNFKRALFSLPAKEEPHLMSHLPSEVKQYIYSFF
jgi:Leucine-rich repeat (LRR) protein